MHDTLYALALLKTNWDLYRRSYIDNFNLLTAECLKYSDHDVVSTQELAGALRERFGLKLPLNIIETLLRRAAKQRWLRREHGVYRIDRAAVNEIDVKTTQVRAISAQDQLLKHLVAFAQDHFSLKWHTDDAERAIFTYLADETLTFLRAAAKRTYVPLPKRGPKSDKYVLASYINSLVASDSSFFDKFRTIAEGNMLVNGIFLPEGSGDAAKKFNGTKLFFDTRFLLSAIGLTGSSIRIANDELLTLARKAAAQTCCFAHTRDEVRAILTGCARNLSAGSSLPGYGPVYDHFLAKKASESDVLLAAARLDQDLEKIGIRLEEIGQRKHEFVLDEARLEAVIRERVNYVNVNALVRDIASVAGVVQLRGDDKPRYLEAAEAIFVTPNRPLVEAVLSFFESDDVDEERVSVAMTDGDLANLLWLKQPVVAPELSRKRLIATFYAAIQPTDEFRRRYLAEVEKLERLGSCSERDVYLLKHSLEARRIAMELTLGEESAFVMGTVADVLEILEAEIRREALTSVDDEKRNTASAREQLQTLQREIDELRNAASATVQRRNQRMQSVARVSASVVALCGGAMLATLLYFTIPEVPLSERMPSSSRAVVASLVAVITFLTWLKPIAPIASLRERAEARIEVVVRRVVGWIVAE